MKLDNKVILDLFEHEVGYEYGRARIVDATDWKPATGAFDFHKTIVFELDGKFWTIYDVRQPNDKYPKGCLKNVLSNDNSLYNVEGESEISEVIKRTICGSVWRFLGQEYYSVGEIYDTVFKRYKDAKLLTEVMEIKASDICGVQPSKKITKRSKKMITTTLGRIKALEPSPELWSKILTSVKLYDTNNPFPQSYALDAIRNQKDDPKSWENFVNDVLDNEHAREFPIADLLDILDLHDFLWCLRSIEDPRILEVIKKVLREVLTETEPILGSTTWVFS